MADDMIELHCRKCKRSSDFRRSDFADVPAWVARIEHDKCNTCDDGDRSAEHWMTEDGREPDPMEMAEIERIKARQYECFMEDHEPLPWSAGRCAGYAGRGSLALHLFRCKRKGGYGVGDLFCSQHAKTGGY